jgi:glutaredoxin
MRGLPLLPCVLVVALVALCGCTREASGPAEDEAASAAPPAALEVTAARTNLLFRYRADDGWAPAEAIAEVPEAARGRVLVIDLDRPPAERRTAEWVQLVDLRAPGADGRYPVRVVPRAELESTLAQAEAARPKQQPVIMYSASWCGVCTKARKRLTAEGVAFVEKDIEKDPAAARELSGKARAAGVSANGVPVFDVGGRLFSGFQPDVLLAAIRGGPT